MTKKDFSWHMHIHTEREGAVFPKNSINEITLRYNFALKNSLKKKILEIGPGTGFGSKDLINNAKSYTCIEYSKENYQILKKNYPNVNIINSDFIKLKSLEDKFDCLVSMANIYYFDFYKFLFSCNNYLEADGKLIFCTTNKLYKNFKPAPFTKNYYSLSELKSILIQYRFQPEFFGGFKNEKKAPSKFIISIIKALKIMIPNFAIKFLKKIIKKTVVLSNNVDISSQNSTLEKIEDDEESNKYIILYCVAKKV